LVKKQRILNDKIRARTVQLITNEWENLWKMNISEAKVKAKELELDLMEIWKDWDISIVKMLDYWKFLYRQKKQNQKNKQKWKRPDLKTVRITFKIWDHDLEIRRKQAEKFAAALHPLKVVLMLKWRENHYWDLAMEKIKSFVESISEVYKLEWDVRRSGHVFSAFLKVKK